MSTTRFGTISASRGRDVVRLAAVLLLGIATVTCTRDLVAPGRVVHLDLAPRFAPGAAPGGSALGVDQIRARLLRHSTQAVVLDKTYPFTTGSSLQLDLTISLQQPTDTLDVDLDYEHGSEVLFSGSQSAVVGVGASLTPISVLVSYVGPGTTATSLAIAPRDTTVSSGDALQFRLTVLDTATPDSVYVGWGSSNAGQAVDATGRIVASLVRGTVTIRAVSPNPPGLRDSTTVRIVPKPAAMVKVSGDGQTGVSGQPLAQPLVVQINGSDLLGVPGVAVTFSVVSGGGSVDTATVVTDSLGRAGTVVALGVSGAQSFKAAAGSLAVTFAETGGAAPPKTWTGAVSADWGAAGNWNPSGVPTATDSTIVPSGTVNAPVIRGGTAYSVNGLYILPAATVTIDTATLQVFGSFTQAGTFADPSNSGALVLNGSGKAVAGSLPILATTVAGAYTLSGDIQTRTLQVLGSLTLGGHAATVSGTFGTAGSGVVTMTNASDLLDVQGNAAFAGGVETGHLTAGTFMLTGNFAVTVTSGFDAGFSHMTVFNGSGSQTVAVFDTTKSNQFGSVDFQNPTNVVLGQLTGINGNATLESKAVVTSTDTTFNGGGLALNGGITTIGGSLLRVGRLYVNTTMSFASATYASTAIILTGNGQTVPTGVTFPFLYTVGNVSIGSGVLVGAQVAVQGGTLTLSGNFSFPGNTFTQFGGSLILNGHTYSTGGSFTANNSGLLKMTNALDTLIVGGSAFFQGASEAGLLSAGGIVVGGSFTEGGGDPQAFASSGTSVAFVNGGFLQTITFGHPGGAGASHFHDLGLGNTQSTMSIASDVYVLGHAAFLNGAQKLVNGGGQAVHFANMQITGVTFNNVAIAYDVVLGGANLIALDSITFQNYSINSATPLIVVVSPGNSLGGSFTFAAMTFLTNIGANAGSGSYLSATETTGNGALIIDIRTNLPIAEGDTHTIRAGTAVVNWFLGP